jgi:hypothetical protein
MKYVVRYFLVIAFVVALVGSTATAQDLQQQLSRLGHEAAIGYVSPILSGWGNDLNSAIYYSADLHDVLGFDVGVKVAMSKFTDADKSFTLDLPTQLPYTYTKNNIQYATIFTSSQFKGNVVGSPGKLSTATAVGDKKGGVVTSTVANTAVSSTGAIDNVPAGTEIFEMPGGFDLGKLGVPLLMPQADLGLPFGLEVMLRYVPTIKTGDVGKFNYMGFGLRYSISQWLPLFPVDIAAHFMTQKMNFKSTTDQDIFTAKGTAYGLEVSKKLFILTLYTGFQLESSTLTLADFQGYDPALGQTVTIPGFEVKGSDKSRFTVGARLLLLIINVHVEYSVAKNPVIAAGVGITIR